MLRRQLRIGLVLALAAGAFALPLSPAQAVATLNVSTTADIPANSGDCGSSSTTPPFPLSLREATCIANNYGNSQAVTINLPAGTYTLSSGELQLNKTSGSNVTLTGAGSASTIIDGNHASRVLDLDPNIVGGVTTSISSVTIANGRDGTFGGAGIIAGSGNGTNLDTLTVSNSVISNNQANFAVPTASNKPGGGISLQGGKLTLTNDTFSNNQSFSSYGSGVWYQAAGSATGQTLNVTGSTFSGNSTANSGASGTSGGALAVSAGAGGGTYTVSHSTFTGNTANSSGNETAVGAAIFELTGNLTVTGSTFTNNSVSNSVSTIGGGPILYAAGTAALHYNRFTGNTGTGGVMTNSGSGSADVTENWWGCNTGPNTTGCETTAGTAITAAPRLVLTATASPSHVVGPNGTSTLTASLLTDSGGSAVSGSNLTAAFDGVPVSFADPPGDATVTLAAGAHSVNLASGTASIDYHSNTTIGPDNDTATLDNGTATVVLEVDEAPSITSANTAHFTTGTSGSFSITTAGYPNSAITESGSLPSGLSFHDNGNGSATISGTAAAGTGGNYPLGVTAANGYSPNATQSLTVSVGQAPAFTSAASATFVIGTAGTFSVTTSGFPTVSTITESGTLPAGVTYTDNRDGTATIAGTPTGTGNTYPVTLTATNGVSPNATQNLSIQVNQAPGITQNPADQTVAPGGSVTFTAAATGVPTPTVQWQRSTNGGVTFTDIGGASSTSYTFTAAAGDNGNQYHAVFNNGVGSGATSTAATLHVGIAPTFTTADHTSFLVGSAGSFDINTTGPPNATLTETGTQFPSWLTLTDNGDGTGTLSGTPPAGSGGSYQFTLHAANGFSPDAMQDFTLSVDDSPSITSDDHTTFIVGSAGSFALTTTGYPTPTLTASNDLPGWATVTDNGDGTATLSGTPPAGTGGTYDFTIDADNGVSPSDSQAFTLTVNEPPTITSANRIGFSAGAPGTFTVTTGGFPHPTVTEVGSLPGGITFTDNGGGTATLSGSSMAVGSYPITITASNGVDPDATQAFAFVIRPTVTSVSPSSGPTTGGTLITIDGIGFTSRSTVLIGQGHGPSTDALTAPVQSQTSTELTATTPAGNKGTWNVFVRTPGAGTSTAVTADHFTYQVPRPTITSVSPQTGPAAGDTLITIDGTGFTAGSTVLIGQGSGPGTGALSAAVQSQTPTEITAITPAGNYGTWNVFVRTPGAPASAAVVADRFTYQLPRPTISSVSPQTGPAGGGTTITIDGTGFTANSTVLIGQGPGNPTLTATVQTQSPTEITAVTPAGNPGTWNVYVRAPGGGTSAVVSADRFTYQ